MSRSAAGRAGRSRGQERPADGTTGKLADRRGSDGAGSDASGPAEADRDLPVLDDHRDVAPLAGVDEHLLEVGQGLLDVAVVDGVSLAGIGLTGRQRVGSGVLAVDEDGAGRAHGCQYTRAGVAPVIRSAAVADLDLLVRMHEEYRSAGFSERESYLMTKKLR